MVRRSDSTQRDQVGTLEHEIEEALEACAGLAPAERQHIQTLLVRYRAAVEEQVRGRLDRQRESNFARALAVAQLGTWDWDISQDRFTWDDTQYAIFGVTPQTFTISLENIWAATHPEDRAELQARSERALRTGEAYRSEFRVLRPDGTVRWCIGGASVVHDAQGQPIRMSGLTYDISEREQAKATLRDSQHFLQRLTETIPNVIYVYDLAAHRNIYANRQLWQLLGYTPEEVQGMGERFLSSVIHPDDWAATPAHIAQLVALDDDSIQEREYRVQHKNGSWRWLFGREMIFNRAEDGTPVQVLGSISDVTAIKEAQKAIQASEARLTAFMEHSPGSMFIKDSAGRYLIVNGAFLQSTNKAASDVIGKTDEQLFPADLAALFVAEDHQVRSSGIEQRFEETFTYNGRRYTFLSHKFPLLDGLVGCVGTDITEQKQTEDRLRYLNAASLAMNAATTSDELLRLIAEAVRTLVGVQDVVVRGHEDVAWSLLRAGGAGTSADQIDAAGGLTFPLQGRDGKRLGLIQLPRDDAAQLSAAERALVQQLGQIAVVALENQSLYAQEQAARAQAEEASRLKDEFLATVSHELRTPLTAFLGYAQLLQSRKRDEAYVARTVEKMVRNARAQAQIIDDLLDVSRIVNGKLRIEARPVDLAVITQAALDTVRPAIEAKGLHLWVDLDTSTGPVIGDAGRLQQVVWNLLSNASKFTPNQGTIRVRLSSKDHSAELQVRDSGQGIAPAFLPYVFDRFRQSDSTSRRQQGGLGLGLAIVRHLVELHGGTVEAYSAGEGQGATFTVSLPLVVSDASDRIGRPMEAGGYNFALPPELRGLRVLLVDDEPDILELLQEVLEHCGAVTRAKQTARDGLEELRSWRPDVLISDIAMPREDGYWLITALRALPIEEGGATPAIALTAYVQQTERLRVLASGFQQYVTKPLEPAALCEVVAHTVRAAHEE
jgi:hypothetical protein